MDLRQKASWVNTMIRHSSKNQKDTDMPYRHIPIARFQIPPTTLLKHCPENSHLQESNGIKINDVGDGGCNHEVWR